MSGAWHGARSSASGGPCSWRLGRRRSRGGSRVPGSSGARGTQSVPSCGRMAVRGGDEGPRFTPSLRAASPRPGGRQPPSPHERVRTLMRRTARTTVGLLTAATMALTTVGTAQAAPVRTAPEPVPEVALAEMVAEVNEAERALGSLGLSFADFADLEVRGPEFLAELEELLDG